MIRISFFMFCSTGVHELSVESYKDRPANSVDAKDMTENQTGHESEHESHGSRHMFMMFLCCLLPIVALFALASIFPGSPYLSFLVLAICPLAMIFVMLPNMLSKKKKEKSSCH